MNYYKTNSKSDQLIKSFFSRELNDQETENFLKTLHEEEVISIINCSFNLKLFDIKGFLGEFRFRNDYGSEEQSLKINPLLKHTNNMYKKCVQLITYFHEATHKKQRDFYMYNQRNNLPETTEYNKLLSREIFCCLEAALPQYEQLLAEHDAIANSIFKYYDHLKKGNIPICRESLTPILYACVKYIASLNKEKHHTYCPENYTLNCDNLLKYHQEFYNNMLVGPSYSKSNLKEVVHYSETLSSQQKKDIVNIDYTQIKDILDNKTSHINTIMKSIYKKLLKLYTPSQKLLNYLCIDKSQWNEFVENNNMVKVAALMCDDMQTEFTLHDSILMKTQSEEEKTCI